MQRPAAEHSQLQSQAAQRGLVQQGLPGSSAHTMNDHPCSHREQPVLQPSTSLCLWFILSAHLTVQTTSTVGLNTDHSSGVVHET